MRSAETHPDCLRLRHLVRRVSLLGWRLAYLDAGTHLRNDRAEAAVRDEGQGAPDSISRPTTRTALFMRHPHRAKGASAAVTSEQDVPSWTSRLGVPALALGSEAELPQRTKPVWLCQAVVRKLTLRLTPEHLLVDRGGLDPDATAGLLDKHLLRTRRSGVDVVFGRPPRMPSWPRQSTSGRSGRGGGKAGSRTPRISVDRRTANRLHWRTGSGSAESSPNALFALLIDPAALQA